MKATGFFGIPLENHEIEERVFGSYIYISMNATSKNPYKENKKEWFKVSVSIPMNQIEQARERIKPGNSFLLTNGDLQGSLLEAKAGSAKSHYVVQTVRVDYKDIFPMKATPQ